MNQTRFSDYVTLKEAEDLSKIKADTLKKRCQNNQILGAIKKGKMWFIPRDSINRKKTMKGFAILESLQA